MPAPSTPGSLAPGQSTLSPRYKWIALSNTTLGVLMATINSSIMLIALPDIFRGIGINPLQPGNTTILLWMIMGFIVVTAVLVVSFGRLGDMFGRVRMFNMGFAVFAAFSILLSVTWLQGLVGQTGQVTGVARFLGPVQGGGAPHVPPAHHCDSHGPAQDGPQPGPATHCCHA